MEMWCLSKPHVFDVVRRTLSGRGGATDPHGYKRCVRVLIPTDSKEKVEGNYIRLRLSVHSWTIQTKR
jgi:hypothetical protein